MMNRAPAAKCTLNNTLGFIVQPLCLRQCFDFIQSLHHTFLHELRHTEPEISVTRLVTMCDHC